jgi:hypothetical protein
MVSFYRKNPATGVGRTLTVSSRNFLQGNQMETYTNFYGYA